MYLFSRVATLRGGERRSLEWAVETCGYVNDHSDHDVQLWRADFGFPVGTFAWTTWAESHAHLNAGFASLLDDDGYHSLIDEGTELLAGPPEDALRQIVYGERREVPAVGAVTTVTTAIMAGGRYGDALPWGTEMAQLVEEIIKMPTLFLADVYGTFGQVTWLSTAPDLASADTASQAINLDEEYLKRLGDVGDLFVPGSGQRALATRVA
jgi:hypothetical protein